MSRASAYAPAHVSGLFAAHTDATDVLAKGSRGAGWSLDRGAHAEVQPGTGPTVVRIDGTPDPAPVTHDALARLAPDVPLEVDIRLELPVGQGFGMSAAGTLAAALAAANLCGLDAEAALQAAHAADVAHGTGLGDVIGSWFGSGEVRIKPGCPPHGWAMQVAPPEGTRMFYVVLGGPIATRSVLGDPRRVAESRVHGDAAVDRILDGGRDRAWNQILVESAVFSHKLGLMPPAMKALGDTLPDGVQWGQCMLGSTMWVYAPPPLHDATEAVLDGAGDMLVAGIDANGARLTRSRPRARHPV